MGFLESVKRTFNIAGAEIAVVTEDEVYSQFDRVAGSVCIKGGEYEQSGRGIKLELKEFWTETRSTGKTTTTVTVYKVHEVVALAEQFSLRPRSEQSYPFDVALPRNARISTRSTGWCLVVSLDIPGAKDPTGRVKLSVDPAEEFLAIVEACEFELGFQENRKRRCWKRSTGGTCFRLLPPHLLKPELDYLQLELFQAEDGGVSGTLTFDLQEKSLGDYFKAIFNRDQVRKPIQLSRSQLFTGDDQANTKTISKVVGECLELVISERQR